MRRFVLAACCGVSVVAGAVYFLGWAGGDQAPPPATDPLQDALGRLERELNVELNLRARGLNTDWDVDAYRAAVAGARHDTALLRGDKDEMGRQLRVLVSIREQYWERMAAGVEHGTASPIEAENARRALAAARYRLARFEGRRTEADEQLRLVAAASDQMVQRLSQAYARQAVGLRDLNRAKYLAGCARYERLRDDGRTADVRAEIDRSVALWEAEVERIGRVYQTGAAAHFEHCQARYYLAAVRLRRATLDNKAVEAAEELRALVRVSDEVLAGLDPTDRFLRRQRPGFEWQRDYDRACLDRLEKDGRFPPDTAAAELGD